MKSPHKEKLAEVREQINTMFDATEDKALLRKAMLGYFQTLHIESVKLGLALGEARIKEILDEIEIKK
tara:strand:+ start:180 stop:383 length:204 start_codon:yes stop_codon:yes gene_type:complete